MTKWIALTIVLVAVVVLALVPVASTMITGRPLNVDCGGLNREMCEQAIARYLPPQRGFLPDYIGISIHPQAPGDTCPSYELHGWIFGRHSRGGSPLC
jgi:hypothetical protein